MEKIEMYTTSTFNVKVLYNLKYTGGIQNSL